MLASQPRSLRLRELLPEAEFFPACSDPIGGVVRNTVESVRHGDWFVLLDEFDASAAEEAEQRGATAVISDRLLPQIETPVVVVQDPHRVYRELSLRIRSAENSPPLIAIGGSDGAAEVATMLASIYASSGVAVGLLTESCEDDGETCRPTPRTLRDTKQNQAWAERCRLGNVSAALIQASPAVTRGAGLRPSAACLVSLRCDGLDHNAERGWPSIAAHRAALESALGRLNENSPLAVNADDPACVAYAASHNGPLVTFGAGSHADVRATLLQCNGGGQEFIVTHGANSACVALPRPGEQARLECVASIAMAIVLGFDLQQAVTGLQFSPDPILHAEPLICGQPYAVLLDEAMRPAALRRALESARSTTSGRVVASIRLSNDVAIAHEQIAAASAMADRVFATGEHTDLITAPDSVTIVPDRIAALAVAIGLADEGDAVLITGCRQDETSGTAECHEKRAAAALVRRRMDQAAKQAVA